MQKLTPYQKYIQWNQSFWNPIFNCQTPKDISKTIRNKTMNISPMLVKFVGKAETGELCANLENLAKTVYYMKTIIGAKGYLHWWRHKAAKNISNNRLPEDQTKLFSSSLWQ